MLTTQPFKHGQTAPAFLLFSQGSVVAAISFAAKPAICVLYPFAENLLWSFSQNLVGTSRFVGPNPSRTATISLLSGLIVKAFKLGNKMHP